MKRSPLKYKPKRHPIPIEILKTVCERDGGTWIGKRCIPPATDKFGAQPDFRGFQFSHRKHRGLGGRPSMNTVENLDFITAISHDLRDGR